MSKFRIKRVITFDISGRQISSCFLNDFTTDIDSYRKAVKKRTKAHLVMLNYVSTEIEGPEKVARPIPVFHVTGANLIKQTPELIHVFPVKLDVLTMDLEGFKYALKEIHGAKAIESLEYSKCS